MISLKNFYFPPIHQRSLTLKPFSFAYFLFVCTVYTGVIWSRTQWKEEKTGQIILFCWIINVLRQKFRPLYHRPDIWADGSTQWEGSRFSSLVSPRLHLERLGGKRLERCNRSSSNEVLFLTLRNNTKQKQPLERFTGH